MLEIPETKVISEQADSVLSGKRIIQVIPASSPHKFTWYSGTFEEYRKLLARKAIAQVKGYGAYVDIICEDNTCISLSDGVNIRFYMPYSKYPPKHQLQLVFEDDSFLVFTVAMYGGIGVHDGNFDNKYYLGSKNSISPLTDAFDENYFQSLISGLKKDMSVKAFLATEQRIPGLGNGVLQDILFCANIHPKRKIFSLTDFEKNELFNCLKQTLTEMTDKGGRDTEKDIFGEKGGYITLLSKNTYKDPCVVCGQAIIKEAYLGGTIYYCPNCQILK